MRWWRWLAIGLLLLRRRGGILALRWRLLVISTWHVVLMLRWGILRGSRRVLCRLRRGVLTVALLWRLAVGLTMVVVGHDDARLVARGGEQITDNR